MPPCDTVAEDPFISTRLMQLRYTERQLSYNHICTLDTTPSVTIERNSSVYSRICLCMLTGTKVRGGNILKCLQNSQGDGRFATMSQGYI